MTRKVVFVTGAAGGIGRSLCHLFGDRGWHVVASDLHEQADVHFDSYVQLDLDRFATDDNYRQVFVENLQSQLPEGLHCLINNAAHQVVAPVERLSADEWHKTLNVNLVSPFLLVKELLESLQLGGGSVINVGSIHASLTKPGFAAYAASKSALEGLTRALAVEIGARVRVNAIAPAAISTPMLAAGFDRTANDLSTLAGFHPSNCLGQPTDVAELAYFFADSDTQFLNGSVIGLDGGIASRLHDPL